MPELQISLLEATTFLDVVRQLPTPPNLQLLNRATKVPIPFPTATWEVIRGARTVATPNVPNSEAHIVPRLGRTQKSAQFVYLREKKVFQPTTLHWLRQPQTRSNESAAEQAVLTEVRDLNVRFDNFWEWSLWQALQGTLTIDSPDVQATVNYSFTGSHVVTASPLWATATPQQIIDNITAWKQLILKDAQVAANEAYSTSNTLALIVKSFTTAGIDLLSDRMRDEYYSTGTLKGFMGLNWNTVDSVYDVRAVAGTFTQVNFLADNKVIFGNFDDNNPIELAQGPTADDEAPENFIGRFAKTWKEKDPSARQYLLEENGLPILRRPDQFVVATV
jgi:hypothetical protein